MAGGTPQQVALHQAFQSLKVDQKKERVVVTANLPAGLWNGL